MKRLLLAFLVLPVLLRAQIITTVAGNGALLYKGDSAAATAASFYYPMGVAVDALGNIFIADALNSVIRKVSVSGIITTIAGNGAAGFKGDGGRADTAELNSPAGLAVDVAGNLYIADAGNARIRMVTRYGYISTVAGGGGSSAEGVLATTYSLTGPQGITFDNAGNMYLSDGNNIYKINTIRIITTIAGTGASGFGGDGGPATAGIFDAPGGLAADGAGNIYVADVNNFRIREINASGVISTIAGNGSGVASGYGGYSGDGGAAADAELNFPTGVAVGPGGVYFTDRNNNRVRLINSSGGISTVAGDGTLGFGGDGGPAVNSQLAAPGSIVIDGAGNLFIADELNSRIRKVSGSGASGVGVAGAPLKEKMELYPNPSDGRFMVTGLAAADRLCLYDLYGACVYAGTATNHWQQVDVHGLTPGTYFLQVWDKDGSTKARWTVVKD